MPMYPPAMTALAPTTIPVRWQPAKVTAAVLCFVSLVMVVVSSFLPLYSGELTFDFGEAFDSSESIEITFSPWSAEYSRADLNDAPGDIPAVGYPLVFGAVILSCAVFACWYAATPGAGRTASRAAGVVTAVSGAFLIGTVWTIAMLVNNGVDTILLLGTLGNGVETDANYLVGYWLLLTAVLLVFAAAVLSLLPVRQPVWQPPPPVNPFAPTPPYGIVLPTVYTDSVTGQPMPVQPAPHAMPGLVPTPVAAVDPLTGQPLAADPLTGQPMPPMPLGAVDPLTGQPSPPSGLPAGPAMAVDPLTGLPITHGPVSPPAGVPAPVHAVPFTPEPVGLTNGTPPAQSQVVEPPPIVLPDAPPLPATPPGPAIPSTEDPLAEPPRS